MNGYIERKKIKPYSTTKTFAMMALEQFERVILAFSVEFRGGFYIQTNISGDMKEVYVPDTREVFCNTCKALALLLLPRFRDETKKKYEEIMDDEKELTKKFLDATSVEETIVLGESFYTTQGDKILLEEYKNMKVKLYANLFEALSWEIQYHKYFAGSSTDD